MITGYLYQVDEKQVKEDLKKKVNISLGVDCNSIIDTILINEINLGGDPALVLSELKKELAIILGKVKEAVVDEPKTEN